ncbi:hypothetical protein HRbin36_00562 [bacterium HR36]|nr:hypothetical protein HRbin36_00562 [bacterium HR36]
MSLTVRCPHCSQELVVGNVRSDAVIVCPKCFQVFSVQTSAASAEAPHPANPLEDLYLESDMLDSTEDEDSQSGTPASQWATRPPPSDASPPAALRTQPTDVDSPSQPAASHPNAEDTWKATILGCIFPLAVFLAITFFLIWYITSRSGNGSP